MARKRLGGEGVDIVGVGTMGRWGWYEGRGYRLYIPT